MFYKFSNEKGRVSVGDFWIVSTNRLSGAQQGGNYAGTRARTPFPSNTKRKKQAGRRRRSLSSTIDHDDVQMEYGMVDPGQTNGRVQVWMNAPRSLLSVESMSDSKRRRIAKGRRSIGIRSAVPAGRSGKRTHRESHKIHHTHKENQNPIPATP